MYKNLSQKNLSELFSSKRLSSYISFDEYLSNIHVSQRYYPELHLIEISLRNKINEILLKNLGKNWITNNSHIISNDQQTKLKNGLNHDDILANLTFGTWINILNQHYKFFTDQDFSYVFNLSKKQINHQYSKLCNELKVIKNFRNRVFHYEKINNHHQYKNIGDLIDKFIRLLDIDNILISSIAKINNNKK